MVVQVKTPILGIEALVFRRLFANTGLAIGTSGFPVALDLIAAAVAMNHRQTLISVSCPTPL